MPNDLKNLAGKLNGINNALAKLGIDTGSLQKATASLQLMGGSAQIVSTIISAKQALNSAKLAEGMAHLAKWGPYALVVAPLAVAGGYVIGEAIERATNIRDDTGLRALARV